MQPDIARLAAIHGRAALVRRETGGADGAVGQGEGREGRRIWGKGREGKLWLGYKK